MEFVAIEDQRVSRTNNIINGKRLEEALRVGRKKLLRRSNSVFSRLVVCQVVGHWCSQPVNKQNQHRI